MSGAPNLEPTSTASVNFRCGRIQLSMPHEYFKFNVLRHCNALNPSKNEMWFVGSLGAKLFRFDADSASLAMRAIVVTVYRNAFNRFKLPSP